MSRLTNADNIIAVISGDCDCCYSVLQFTSNIITTIIVISIPPESMSIYLCHESCDRLIPFVLILITHINRIRVLNLDQVKYIMSK